MLILLLTMFCYHSFCQAYGSINDKCIWPFWVEKASCKYRLLQPSALQYAELTTNLNSKYQLWPFDVGFILKPPFPLIHDSSVAQVS